MVTLEEKELKLKQKQTRKSFIAERTKKTPKFEGNNKMNERVATILGILSELLSESGRHGLRLHELIKRTNKTKPTLLKNLRELKEMGVVIETDKKWNVTSETGSFYRDLQNHFGFLDFSPIQIKTFKNISFVMNGQTILATGSVWTNQYTTENNPNKLIEKGQAGLIIMKPAGGQLNL